MRWSKLSPAQREALRLAQRQREKLFKAEAGELIAYAMANTVHVQRLKAGVARGASYLHRAKARALPMGQGINGRI